MINIKVSFENGDYLYTKFNGNINQSREDYIGKTLVFGIAEEKTIADSVVLVGGNNK